MLLRATSCASGCMRAERVTRQQRQLNDECYPHAFTTGTMMFNLIVIDMVSLRCVYPQPQHSLVFPQPSLTTHRCLYDAISPLMQPETQHATSTFVQRSLLLSKLFSTHTIYPQTVHLGAKPLNEADAWRLRLWNRLLACQVAVAELCGDRAPNINSLSVAYQ